MARKAVKVDGKVARGSKTEKLVKLALREQGVSGTEIIEGLGWPSGSAKFRVRLLAEKRGYLCKPARRPDGIKAYRLVPKQTKAKSAPRAA